MYTLLGGLKKRCINFRAGPPKSLYNFWSAPPKVFVLLGLPYTPHTPPRPTQPHPTPPPHNPYTPPPLFIYPLPFLFHPLPSLPCFVKWAIQPVYMYMHIRGPKKASHTHTHTETHAHRHTHRVSLFSNGRDLSSLSEPHIAKKQAAKQQVLSSKELLLG